LIYPLPPSPTGRERERERGKRRGREREVECGEGGSGGKRESSGGKLSMGKGGNKKPPQKTRRPL